MKFFLAIGVVALVAIHVYAVPLDENDELEYGGNLGIRQRRVTCDLLSPEIMGSSLKDAACAGNCLSMGKAGGKCNGGICECRSTTFKELWDKRFG